MPGVNPVGFAVTAISVSPVIGDCGIVIVCWPTVRDFSYPQANLTTVVWLIGFTFPANSAVLIERETGFTYVTAVGASPGAFKVLKLKTFELASPDVFVATIL